MLPERDEGPSVGLASPEVSELYQRYGLYLRRRCVVLLRDDALVDDAMQETFVRLMHAGLE